MFLGWNYRDIDACLAQLTGLQGFPSASQLWCPVFRQDKIGYLHACDDICNISLKVDLPCLHFDIKFLDSLDCDDEGKGWVVKAPFTTNKEMRWYCHTKEMVLFIIFLNVLGRLAF